MKKMILASKSPRRHEILSLGGYDHEIKVSDADETFPEGLSIPEGVKELSRRKADAVLCECGGGIIVIAADTVVELDGEVFGKPKGKRDAFRMLSALSGREHFVHTGLTVSDGERTVCECVTSKVIMRNITEKEINLYIDSGEPMDKAGAYGIQGAAGAFVSGIEGDWFSIMGLPLCRLSEILNGFGAELFESGKDFK